MSFSSNIGIHIAQDIIAPITQAKLKSFYNVGFDTHEDPMDIFMQIIKNSVPKENVKVYIYFKYNINPSLIYKLKFMMFKDFVSKIYIKDTNIIINFNEETMLLYSIDIKIMLKKLSIHKLFYDAISINQNTISIPANIEEDTKIKQLYYIKNLFKEINETHISGHVGLQNIFWHYDENCIVAKSINIRTIFPIAGIDYKKTYSNNIQDMYQEFGIIKAKETLHILLSKFLYEPHRSLLVNSLTYTGTIIGATFSGFKNSELMTRLSFENVMDVLRDYHELKIESVNELSSKLLLGKIDDDRIDDRTN